MINTNVMKFCPEILAFVAKDLQKKGHEETFALRAVYNSYVLDDSAMEAIYRTLNV